MLFQNIKTPKSAILMMVIFCVSFLHAQTDKELLADLVADEQEAVNALVMYPSDTRLAILNTTAYPDVLIKIESLQVNTKKSFQNLMNDYSQDEQEMIWDLTRYPDLIPNMVEAGKHSRSALEKVLEAYPEVIHPRAEEAHRYHYDLLTHVVELEQAAELAFTTIIDKYPDHIQQSFRDLKELPEALSLLTDNIKLTVLVGAIYVEDPDWLIHKADSLHDLANRQNAQEVDQWISNLENDPEALEELKQSTESYVSENGYDDDYYDYEADLIESPEVVHVYYQYHYPYWFGYPSWYRIPRWRCYPIYYDWGFYYPLGSQITIINIPSYNFMSWYFYHGHHHYYWPHLSSHFIRHHHHYHYTHSTVSTTVNIWLKQNKEVVTKEWVNNEKDLPNRMREFGKFETERADYNRKNPGKKLSQKDYAIKNSTKYPTFSKTARDYNKFNATELKPVKNPTDNTKVYKPGKKAETPTKKTPRVEKPQTRTPKINKTKKTNIPPKTSTTRKPQVRDKATVRPSKPKMQKTVPRTTPKKAPQVKRGNDNHKQVLDKRKVTKPKTTTSTKQVAKTSTARKSKQSIKKKGN